MEMLTGGALLLVASGLLGEWRGFEFGQVSRRSWIAVAYLTTFGSIVAYSAYMWLMQVTTPARASTNAYVNPIVAVLLGWWLGGEAMNARIILAAGVIILAVVLLISHRPEPPAEIA